jgi:hypothetical protein
MVTLYEYGRVTGMGTGMSIRRKAKLSLIKAAAKIVILCVVFFWVFPNYIAPQFLGITPEVYEANRFLLGIVAGAVSAPFMWFSDKIIEYQMGR